MRVIYENRDTLTAKHTLITRDSETGLPVIRMTQNFQPVLRHNHHLRTNYDPHKVRQNPGGWRQIASIPNVVVLQLNWLGIMKGTRVVDEKRLFKFLSDPANRYLRTDNGKRLA